MAGVLVGLRAKGIRPSEVAGGVRALRKAMLPVASSDADRLVDTAGTGGGSVTTFNISTAAALVAAGAGVPVAKHGNRSFTSRCGSADVLEVLGVGIELTPERMAEVLAEAGIVFMFAPLLHPAMRHVGPVRRKLGITTIMNILGPLTNPAGARRQVIGVADPSLLDLIPGALQELGHIRALVVHGDPGMDELSPVGTTRVVELQGRGHRGVRGVTGAARPRAGGSGRPGGGRAGPQRGDHRGRTRRGDRAQRGPPWSSTRPRPSWWGTRPKTWRGLLASPSRASTRAGQQPPSIDCVGRPRLDSLLRPKLLSHSSTYG